MRIFFVDTGGGVGGSTISLYYLVRGLVGTGHAARVFFPWPHAWSEGFEKLGAGLRYQRPTAPPVATARTGAAAAAKTRPWTNLGAWKALHFYRSHWRTHAALTDRWVDVLREEGPDLVYTNNDLPLNFEIVEAADRLGMPVVCHLRGFQPIRGPHRKQVSKLRAGIAISESVRRHYLDAGFDPTRIHRVYNGIDMKDYPWSAPSTEISATGGRLLFLGRLTGWKGAPVLLEAVARLRSKRPDLSLSIAGDGPARGEWEAEVERRGLGASVRFAGFTSEVVGALRNADVLVHASIEPEPFGRVLIEGMATGTPVVATSLGATSEIIEDGINGRLVPAAQPEPLARAIDEMLRAGPGRLEMARAARRRVEEHFTVEKMVSGVEQVLSRVLTGAASGATQVSHLNARQASHG